MISGLRFVGELGSGTSSIADLYEDHRGRQFVLRTSVLSFNEVTINKKGQYELVYRFSHSGLDTTRTREFAFYDLVSKMPKHESQYFIRMHRYDITKGVTFNANRLKQSSTKDSIMSTPVSDRIFIRQLIDYGGTSLDRMLENRVTLDMDLIGNALLKMIKIMRKYKWFANDIHPGNICINNGIVKLVDYGSNYLMTNPNTGAINTRYDAKADALDVLSVIAGFDTSRISGLKLPDYNTYFNDIRKMKVYPKISKLMISVFSKSSHGNYITTMMNDIGKGTIIDEYGGYTYYMSVLWTVIDKKSFDNYVKTCFPEYEPVDIRAKQSVIHDVLQYAIGGK